MDDVGAQQRADPVELLRRESRSLVERLRLWTPARWAARAPVLGTRADVAQHLAQTLADDAADAVGAPRRTVPRLDSDLALPDQLAVTADDLCRVAADEAAVPALAHLLLHRRHLLDDAVPSGLAAALGLGDVEAAGRRYCASSTGH